MIPLTVPAILSAIDANVPGLPALGGLAALGSPRAAIEGAFDLLVAAGEITDAQACLLSGCAALILSRAWPQAEEAAAVLNALSPRMAALQPAAAGEQISDLDG